MQISLDDIKTAISVCDSMIRGNTKVLMREISDTNTRNFFVDEIAKWERVKSDFVSLLVMRTESENKED